MFKFYTNLSVRWKMLIVMTIPLIIIIYLFAQNIIKSHQEQTKMESLSNLVELSIEATKVVHELQKERGMSAGYLNSKGQKFSTQLNSQRKLSDDEIQIFSNILTNFSNYQMSRELLDKIDAARESLKLLQSFRDKVNNFDITTIELLNYYTNTIGNFILIVSGISSEVTTEGEITNLIHSFKNFVEMKERNGIIRATLNAVFTRKSFTPETYKRFIEVLAEHNTYESNFLRLTNNKEILSYYDKIKASPAGMETQKIIDYAINSYGKDTINYNPEKWFAIITEKIDLMKECEDFIAQIISTKAIQIKENAQQQKITSIVVAIVTITLTVWLILIIINNIIRNLKAATERIVRISQGIL